MSRFYYLKELCPFCAESTSAVVLHNMKNPVDNNITIIDVNRGDIRVSRVARVFEEVGENAPRVPSFFFGKRFSIT